MEYIFTIDLGTSGPKVALVSTEGEVVCCVKEPTRVNLLPNGGAEQSPDDWWRAITAAADKVWQESPVSPSDVSAVACSAQWSGTVAVDQKGNPLHDAIIWMDSRGAPYIQQITDGLIKIEGYALSKIVTWIRKTGGAPGKSGKDPIAHILFLKNEKPDVYSQTFRFLEAKDYLNLKLTGQFSASFDSITLHWVTDSRDIDNIHYDDQLMEMAGIEPAKLPELRASTDILDELLPGPAEELGVPAGLPVVMGTPDIQAAAIGSGAVMDFEPHLYVGTSSWITCHVPYKKTDLFHNMASIPSGIPGKYFIANEQETAGACLDFLIRNVMNHALPQDDSIPDSLYTELNSAAAAIPAGSDGLLFLPWLYGERTPVEDHTIRGGFTNLSLSHGKGHLVRSVMEGVALNARWLLKYVEKFARKRMDNIHFIGGGANSAVWCQIMADVLGRTILQVKDPLYANARGTAALAAVALGETSFEQFGANIQIAQTFHPNGENATLYEDRFDVFLKVYKQNKKIHAHLNRQQTE
tara:strand:- start:5402 stop:6976 length:1575 start_codon:yes stop_codon:yes gene_type:complete